MALDFFFVVSGFLISYQLFELRDAAEQGQVKASRGVWNYMLRRALRIFPLYYLVMILATIFNEGEIKDAFIYNLTYTSNFYFIKAGHLVANFSHFWSLSVEEHFYLVWPLLVIISKRKHLIPLMILLILVSVGFRYYAFYAYQDERIQLIHTLSCVDMFMCGAFLAYFYLYYKDRFTQFFGSVSTKIITLTGMGLSYYLLIFVSGTLLYDWVFFRTVFGTALAGLIGLAVVGFKGPVGKLLEHPWLIKGGKISYAIYLTHHFVPGLLMEIEKLHLPRWVEISVYTAVTIGVSHLLYTYVEKPVRRLGQKLKAKVPQAPAAN